MGQLWPLTPTPDTSTAAAPESSWAALAWRQQQALAALLAWHGSEFLLGHTWAGEMLHKPFPSPLSTAQELLWQEEHSGAGSQGKGWFQLTQPHWHCRAVTWQDCQPNPSKLHPAPPRAAPLALNTWPSQVKPGSGS